MTRHETIITGRGARKRAVRVERKRGSYTRAEIDGIGLTAIGDALFRMGGTLSGRDVLRILTEGKRASEPVAKIDMDPCRQPEPPICQANPLGRQSREATKPENQARVLTGALADDVCRHIWAERGRFAPILYGSGM